MLNIAKANVGFVLLASLMVSACGGSYTVVRMNTPAPEHIVTAALSPQDGNSPEVDGYITDAIISQGVAIAPPLPARMLKSDQVDAVATYTDVWRWDLAMYMQSISINLYNSKTGELLVTGRWRDSFFHAWHRGELIAQELLTQMFSKLKGDQKKSIRNPVETVKFDE